MEDKLNRFVADVVGCGMFQILATAASNLLTFCGAWGMLFMTFGNYDPGWTCLDDVSNTSFPVSVQTNVTTTLSSVVITSNSSFSNTSKEEVKCMIARSCKNLRFSQEASTVVTEWSLICHRAWLGSLITSIQMVGVTLGSLVAGQVGERFGRKKNMYGWCVLLAVTNIIAVFSISWEMYAAIRFFIGIGIGGILSSSSMYAIEFASGKWRTFISGFPDWAVGCMFFAFLVLLLKDWRQLHIATAVLCVVSMFPVFWVPENLRWLSVHGRTEEARRVALKMCRFNRKPIPDDDVIDFSGCEGRKADKRSTLLHLFRRSLIKKTVLCFSIFFLLAIMYYAIGFGIGSLFGDFYLNFILYTSVRIPLFPLVPLLGNKLGRRWGSISLLAVSFLSSLVIVIILFTVDGETQGYIVTSLSLTTAIFAGLSWEVMCAFVAELYPTSVRSLGYCFSYVGARAGGVVAPHLLPREMTEKFVSFLVMVGLALVCSAMILALPETNERGLDDVMATTRSKSDQKEAGNDTEKCNGHLLSDTNL